MIQAPESRISVVIPTYKRERVLIETVEALKNLEPAPLEILVVDQTEGHEASTLLALTQWDRDGSIRWIRLQRPSITHAMNVGLEEALGDVVLFVDDDIVPGSRLLSAHARAQFDQRINIVAGQVLQGSEVASVRPGEFRFSSSERRFHDEFMGCNFSVRRKTALALGGFDENFVHVAYRFEAEFCNRALQAGERILFEPAASLQHLKTESGGTRAFGNHLTTVKPSHAVGAYYFLFRARNLDNRFGRFVGRFFRSVRTRHHFMRPWWIPGTLIAEMLGLCWAAWLFTKGPQLIAPTRTAKGGTR